MPEYLTQKEAFEKCKKCGKFIAVQDLDLENIKSRLVIAEGDIESGESLRKNLAKDSKKWNSVYKLYYDSLHELVEAFLRFDSTKTDNHQCLFAYLCEKHPELEFSWDFFEKVRTKRNGINYYGSPINQDDWKEVELQFGLYLKKMKDELKKKIKEQESDLTKP
jgi:hypothetical protein